MMAARGRLVPRIASGMHCGCASLGPHEKVTSKTSQVTKSLWISWNTIGTLRIAPHNFMSGDFFLLGEKKRAQRLIF